MSFHGGRAVKRKRDANYKEIVDAFHDCGCMWIDLDPVAKSDPGCPDGIAIWPGGFCMVEIKTSEGRLSPEQEAWHARYRGPKGTLAVVRSRAQALAIRGVHSPWMPR